MVAPLSGEPDREGLGSSAKVGPLNRANTEDAGQSAGAIRVIGETLRPSAVQCTLRYPSGPPTHLAGFCLLLLFAAQDGNVLTAVQQRGYDLPAK